MERSIVAFVVLVCALASPAFASDCGGDGKRLLWGDLHAHTAYSMDAFVFGAVEDPASAYRFAKGEPRRMRGGGEYALSRPLDFAAVTDHSEYFGVMNVCGAQRSTIPYCQALRDASDGTSLSGFTEFFLPFVSKAEPICPLDTTECVAAQRDLWQQTIAAANDANEPCRFTAFVASEWSASPGNLHWHRNLVYAGDRVPAVPINSLDEPTQEAMWQALDSRCRADEGCRVLAIPHNSNLSLGGTFRIDHASLDDLALRARYERLVEVHQHKGQSECYPGSLFADEDCAFEMVLPIPIGQRVAAGGGAVTAEEQGRIASGYVRDALVLGLEVRMTRGVNPFRYGFIGSSDTHSATPGAVDESSWHGAIGSYDQEEPRRAAFAQYNPGGLAAVWATANTRDAIFEALSRGETYATSGPRIGLQFMHSADPATDLCTSSAPGVTVMGGVMADDASPIFFVHALADQVALDEIDIVKLSYVGGMARQSIVSFPVDRTDGRRDWCIRWHDEAHRPGEPALWYARVLQRPTPRWNSTADAPRTIRERAWSSPIWSLR